MGKEIILISFDGTDYCYITVSEGGRRKEKKCCQAKEVIIENANCVLSGFSDRPGFLMECEALAECSEGKLVVRNT